tara:strand:- start:1307 stop:2599 length:1293 start_codon:yes stop_codon:yes gene_type:complete
MSKKKDWVSLGEAYGNVLNKVVVNEEVPHGEIGKAPLESGGPEERGGFRPSKIDITKLSDKDKEDNIYNIGGLTYGDGNDPGLDNNEPEPTGPTYGQVAYSGNVGPPEEDEEDTEKERRYEDRWGKDLDREREREGSSNAGNYSDVDKDDFCGPAGGAAPGTYPCDTIDRARSALRLAYNAPDPDGIKRCVYNKFPELKDNGSEEDEEILAEHEKIARAGLNNFMSKTSVFDKLYNKVMVNEEFDEVEDVTELEALGIETDEVVDEVPEEITVSIPGELAQSLCDILQTALAQQEVEVDVDVDVEEVTDTDFEEDAETARQKTYGGNKGDHPRRYNKKTGRKSEVRDYEEDEEAVMKDGGGYGVDAGSTLKKEINYGKKNKVGKLHAAGGPVMKDGGGYGVDAGSTLSKEINYGKNNKVGNTKLGSIPGA